MTTATLNKYEVVSQLIANHPDWFVELSQENPLVNAIRFVNGRKRIVEVRWNELTESEQRQAYNAVFDPYGWELL